VTVPAQAGYPFRLRLVVTYSLTEQGLAISLEATNTGQRPDPVNGWAVVQWHLAGA
jgi:galactose mutarotase-like enzyme